MSTYHPSLGSSSGLGSVFKSITKTFKQSSTKNVPVSINPTVVGGGQDLQDIIRQLQTTTSNTTKLNCLQKLTESIEKYSISSLPEIWYLVHQYCEYTANTREIRKATLRLLNTCIKKEFDTENTIDPDFDLFMDALVTLTNDGRDIHDFIIYEDRSNLNIFLENSLRSVIALSDNYKFQSDEKDEELMSKDKNFVNILNVLEFTKNCIKFNYATFNEQMVSWIIEKLGQTKSSNKLILTGIIDCFNSILMYGHFPYECIPQTIAFLSQIYGSSLDQSLNLSIWQCTNNICTEDTFHIVIESLCDNIGNPDLKGSTNQGNIPLSCCLGSIRLLRFFQARVVTQKHNLLELVFTRIINSYKIALATGIPQINSEVLDCFDKLFAKDAYRDNFDIDFTDSIDKIFPFQLWHSTNSIYDLLNLFQINNEQDENRLQSMCLSLQSLYESQELPTPKHKLVGFFGNYIKFLPVTTMIFVLQYYNEEKLCSLLSPFWKENSMKILNNFYFKRDVDVTVRTRCLQVIFEGYTTSLAIFNDADIKYEIVIEIFKRSLNEQSDEVLHYLVDKLMGEIIQKCPSGEFNQIIALVKSAIPDSTPKLSPHVSVFEGSIARSFVSTNAATTVSATTATNYGNSDKLIERFVKLLCTTFIKSQTKRAQECFDTLIDLANLAKQNSNILLIISKCLVRIRATTENYIYFVEPSDMAGLASAFKRDETTNSTAQWTYPETVDYLPRQYFYNPNRNLLLRDGFLEEEESGRFYIDIQKWFQLVLYIMDEFIDWEIYSYVWAHFVGQLSNMKLFYHCDQEISKLRLILCDQLTLKLPSSLVLPKKNDDTEITKADLQVVFVRSFSSFIGYHDKFSKIDEDHIINSLIIGLGSWEKTAIPCINILTVCCYEIPLSIMKFLNSILTKLQTRITSANAAAHALEFLISLAEIPKLTANFTIEDFKQGFGIAFKYIQYAKDWEKRDIRSNNQPEQQQQSKSQPIIQAHGIDAEVEQTPSTRQVEITPIMTEYIMTLSYNLISSWFVTLRMTDRKQLSNFVTKNLVLCTENSNELDDQTIGSLDFISRFTHSDIPLELNYVASNKSNNDSTSNKWVVDNSVISIDTDTQNGNTELIIRKATGVSKFHVSLDRRVLPVKNGPIVLPDYFLSQFINQQGSEPQLIPDDANTSRAISVLDRTPTCEFHKIGIIYIGKNQTTENEVLGNKIGSQDYHKFLSEIGDLISLKGCKNLYTGGLDTENNMDGEFARHWRGKYTQIIFHVTTMMNNEQQFNDDLTDIDMQRLIDMRKRHIGNNHVNIFFDESGKSFNFNLIKSQFNFLSIVISPHTVSQDFTIDEPNNAQKFFKVKSYRRAGVPPFFGTSHYKLVSGKELASFVRTTSILADMFANTWHGGRSIWAQRVKQLKLIESHSRKAI
ncbi:tsc2 Tuberous sclerosis 2 protein [Candida maltosa Xu316]